MPRESQDEAAAKRRCPVCKKWFLGQRQRDEHVVKKHPKP